jgi:hypothetical protein
MAQCRPICFTLRFSQLTLCPLSQFMGSGQFCIKACDPSRPNAANYCQHIYDLIGCAYNAPASYADGVFDSCLGDSQDFPGVYTGANGVVSTYVQPAGPIVSLPYTPKIPATSSCTNYTSASLYAGAVRILFYFIFQFDLNPSFPSTRLSASLRGPMLL